MPLEYESETERHLVNVLGRIYRQSNWRGQHSYGAFETAMMVAKNETSAGGFIQKMCKSLGAGTPSISIDSLNHIRKNWEDAIGMIRTKSTMLTLFAGNRAAEMRREKEEMDARDGAGKASGAAQEEAK